MRRQWHPTPVLLPGKSHGLRSLVGCSPWGLEESDTTERLHFDFSLSCIGEGNGNPLQCSCPENPRDRGAWWAAVSGVTQSRTQLKRLSSSSNICRTDPSTQPITPTFIQAAPLGGVTLYWAPGWIGGCRAPRWAVHSWFLGREEGGAVMKGDSVISGVMEGGRGSDSSLQGHEPSPGIQER